MGKYEAVDIILGILYVTGALALLIVSYRLYIRRFKRNKLEAVSEVLFTTSREDVYSKKTQFIIQLSDPRQVTLRLKDMHEETVMTILDEELPDGENIIDFNPEGLAEGNYYLSLDTIDTSILRKIKIITTHP